MPASAADADGRIVRAPKVLDHLGRALREAARRELAELAAAFDACCDSLQWSQNQGYTLDNCSSDFLDGYAYASLSGPEGPMRLVSPRGGFALMAPRVEYPDHQHAATEIYLIMTPGVQWRLDGGDWFDVRPGDLIHHAPWVMHATSVGDIPLLAYAAWLEPGNRNEIYWAGDREPND